MTTTTTRRKALAISGRGMKAAEKANVRNAAVKQFGDAAQGSENAALVMVEAFVRYITTGATVEDTRKALADEVKTRGISNPSVYTGRAENGAAVSVALGVLPSNASDLELQAIRNARLVTGPNGDQAQRREDIAALVEAVAEGTDPRKALTTLKASRKPQPEDKDETPDVTPEDEDTSADEPTDEDYSPAVMVADLLAVAHYVAENGDKDASKVIRNGMRQALEVLKAAGL